MKSLPAAAPPQHLLLYVLVATLAISVTTTSLVCQPARSSPSVAASSNPVLPGDHPDPSIIRVGKTYWTASTSGDWSPQFALFRSTDLHHWTPAGFVFPHQPSWATGSFWAPELVYDGGRVLVYYVARKRDGPLCVAAATAAEPQGPYTDHGPILCEHDGSIDPAFARDEHGAPYLIWKEDGNSEGKPTPLWAQPLASDLLHLTGEKKQLLVNDPSSWEGGVVEAPYILRHGGFFYLFYAGNGCCGSACHYAEGVARAEHLLGPWTKDPKNPIIGPNERWRCPGHGSAVETPQGEDYFLYHAYPVQGSIYLGRESVLDRISWAADNWPAINGGRGPGGTTAAPVAAFANDDFAGTSLSPEWRWPVNHEPNIALGRKSMTLTASNGDEALVARSLASADYTASVDAGPDSTGLGSLVVTGNAKHAIGLGRREGTLELWRTGEEGHTVLWHGSVSHANPVDLRVTSTEGGARLAFSYSVPGGGWKPAGEPVDVSRLPQWDQGLRVGLAVDGTPGEHASFSHFEFRSH